MNRSAECIMDAGCLPEFQPTRKTGTSARSNRRSFSQIIGLWHQRSKQRRELLSLAKDMSLLDDVGLSMYDVKREAQKYFWED